MKSVHPPRSEVKECSDKPKKGTTAAKSVSTGNKVSKSGAKVRK